MGKYPGQFPELVVDVISGVLPVAGVHVTVDGAVFDAKNFVKTLPANFIIQVDSSQANEHLE